MKKNVKQSSIKENFLYNVIYQILLVLLPLLTSPYISRVLGKDGIGIYSYQYTIANCFALIGMLGVNNYGNRSIAAVRDHKEERSRTFWSIWILQFLFSAFAAASYIGYIRFFCEKEHRMVAMVLCSLVFASIFDINWFFFGLEKFKITVTRNIIVKLLSIICIFLFVKSRTDIWIYSLIIAGSMFLSNIAIWPFLKKEVILVRLSFREVTKHTSQMLTLFVPIIAVTLYNKMDKVMLGSLSTMSETGFYENTEKIINIPIGIVTALGTVMLPRMSYLFAKNDREASERYFSLSLKFACILSCAMTFGIAGIADHFAPWFFGDAFSSIGILIMLLSPKIIFLSVANVIRTQYLIPRHNDKPFLVSVWAGAAVNLILNAILIPAYGALGAVIGTLAAEFMVMVYQMISVNKEIPIFRELIKNTYFLFAGFIMFICVQFVGSKINEGLITIIIQILTGFCVYMVLCLPYLWKFYTEQYHS